MDTVWRDGFACPDSFYPDEPDEHYTAVLRATEGVDFTRLVVRFPTHVTYESRAELFNLVGWTEVPDVVLGEDLAREDWVRAGD